MPGHWCGLINSIPKGICLIKIPEKNQSISFAIARQLVKVRLHVGRFAAREQTHIYAVEKCCPFHESDEGSKLQARHLFMNLNPRAATDDGDEILEARALAAAGCSSRNGRREPSDRTEP
jgi:hypothetical protein